MNKVIISVLILLLAVQGMQCGIFAPIVGFFRVVFGFVFRLVFTFPPVIITFVENFVVTVQTVVFTALSGMNFGLYKVMVRFSLMMDNAKAVAGVISGSVNASEKTGGQMFAKFSSGIVDEVVMEVGYTASAIASISVGCAPPPSQPLKLSGAPYSAFSCFVSGSSCNTTSISCQAQSLVSLFMVQIENLIVADEILQIQKGICSSDSISNDTSTNSTTNSTSSGGITEIIAMWTTLSGSLSAQLSNSESGAIMVAVGGSFSADLTAAMDATEAYFETFKTTQIELLQCGTYAQPMNCRGKAKGSGSGGSSGSSEGSGGSRRNRRRGCGKLKKMFKKMKGRKQMKRAMRAMMSFRATVDSALMDFSSVMNEHSSAITSSFNANNLLLPAAQQYGQAFIQLSLSFGSLFTQFATDVNTTSANCESSKLVLTDSVTETINATADVLLSLLELDTSECGVSATDSIQEIISEAFLLIDQAEEAANAETNEAFVTATNVFLEAFTTASSLMTKANDCYKNGCSANVQYPFPTYGMSCVNDGSMWRWAFLKRVLTTAGTNMNNCFISTTSSINSAKSGLSLQISGAIGTLTSAITAANNELTMTVQEVLSVFMGKFQEAKDAYASCLEGLASNSTNSTAETNTTVTP